MRVSVTVVVALCLVTSLGAIAVGVGPVTGQQNGVPSDIDNNTQTIEIWIDEDGDANISVYKQFELDGDEDEVAFEQLTDEFEDGEASDELSAEVFERLAADAENETDREMEIAGIERGSESTNSTGTLRLSFVWEGFANAENDSIEIGDVFVIDEESWLPSLSSDQRLVIHSPEGYAVENAETPVNNGVLVWEGPTTFEDDELDATFVPSGQTSEGFSLLTIGLGVGLVGLIVLIVFLLSQRRSEGPLAAMAASDDRGWATLLTPATDRTEERSTRPESAPAVTEEPDSKPDSDPFAGVDEELLSDEERVVRLLEANDGRMKQATIVTETDWSNAKVSQLLSAMAERNEIEKLRIGRENLITLCEE